MQVCYAETRRVSGVGFISNRNLSVANHFRQAKELSKSLANIKSLTFIPDVSRTLRQPFA